MYRAALLGATLIFFSPVILFAYSSPGKPTGHINDFAEVLSAETKKSLEQELVLFNASTSNEIAVAIVKSMDSDYVEHYATKLFEEWHIGKKDKDNGVLLLISVQEHALRIEVGYGLEGALPDSVASRILHNEMTPRLKRGDYDGAVTEGARAIEKATQGEYSAATETVSLFPKLSFSGLIENGWILVVAGIAIFQWLAAILSRTKSWWAGGVLGFACAFGINWLFALANPLSLGLIALMTVLGLAFDFLVSNSYKKATSSGFSPPWWTGGSSSPFGGSSEGSFGGFGGGSSGGGGASGSW